MRNFQLSYSFIKCIYEAGGILIKSKFILYIILIIIFNNIYILSCDNNDTNVDIITANNEDAIDFINEWLSLRYDKVSFENVEEKLILQENYYSSTMQSNSFFVGNNDEIIEYFNTYNLYAEIIYKDDIKLINSSDSDVYECSIIALYIGRDISYDHYIQYDFKFTLEYDNGYKFNNIEIEIGDKIFTNGHDLHVNDNEVEIMYDEECGGHDH